MASDFGTAPSMASGPLQTGAGTLRRAGVAVERWLDAERDQLFLWLPVALGAGIAAWLILPGRDGWIAFLLCASGVAVGIAATPGGGRMRRALAIFALVAGIGTALIWIRAEAVATPRLERPVMAHFTGRVETVERLAARDSIRVRLAPIGAPALPPHVRVNIDTADAPAGLATAATVSLRARLMPPPDAAVPGAYDFARVAWFQQLGATGRAIGPVTLVAPAAQGGVWAWLMERRARLSAHIQGQSPGGAGAVAASFATGDQGAIPDNDAEALRRAGLAHLLSVSGLHVTAVIAGTMFLLLRLLALSPRLALHAPLLMIAAGAGALAGIAYTLLTGAEVPTIRSCIASLLVLIGIAIGRDAITLRLVASGALIVLLLWPEALAGASFQLSFAAVTAIIALNEHPRLRAFLARREEGQAARLGRAVIGLLLTGVIVELALMPIGLFHFHRAGVYGALANIVAIPLTTFVIMPLEALALLFDMAGLGAPFWWLATGALRFLLWLAHFAADAPGAVTALPSMPRGAFALMVAGGLWIALWRTRVRRLGLMPLAIGAFWALITPPPDILVTRDGKHLAIRTADGSLALLRSRAGEYVRDMLSENAGTLAEPGALEDVPAARCGPDLCVVELVRGERRWRLLATRTPYLVDIAAMNRACAAADIVVSDRRLPRSCTPRWLKADRAMLARTGGLAIHLASGRVISVAGQAGRHPWVSANADQVEETKLARFSQ